MQYNISYRNKNGSIQYIISYKDNTGKWKQKAKQGFKTKREAKRAADKALEDLRSSVKLTSSISGGMENMTIGQLKADYLEHVKIYKATKTLLARRSSLKRFNIDDILVKDLKLSDIQKCVNLLVGKNKVITIKLSVRHFGVMLKYANKQYNIPVVSLDNIDYPEDKDNKERKFLNDKETLEVLEFFKKGYDEHYMMIYLAANAGLRMGEILALTWDDIDLENKKISINKQWNYTSETSFGFCPLKSKNSIRIIPISDSVAKEINEYKNITSIKLHQRLFTAINTNALNCNINRKLNKHFEISMHTLRHAYCTKLVKSGKLDFKTIANIMGHDVEMTMRTYSHVTDEMLDKASEVISHIF